MFLSWSRYILSSPDRNIQDDIPWPRKALLSSFIHCQPQNNNSNIGQLYMVPGTNTMKQCFQGFFFVFFFLTFIIGRQRETEHEHGRGRERRGHRIWSRFQALSCQHRVWRGAGTHKPWDHDLSRSWCPPYWATQAPLKKFFLNVYLFLRDWERQSMSRGGAEREGDTESEAGSWLWAVSTESDVGLELTNCEIMT